MMTHTELLPEIFKLPQSDQLMIAEAIRNHVIGGFAPVDEGEFKAELDRRLADAETNPNEESTLDEVMARLRAKE